MVQFHWNLPKKKVTERTLILIVIHSNIYIYIYILHNISHKIAKINTSLLLAIILIKNIQLSVASQALEVRVKTRLRRLHHRLSLK